MIALWNCDTADVDACMRKLSERQERLIDKDMDIHLVSIDNAGPLFVAATEVDHGDR
jgi:hypothetical protein